MPIKTLLASTLLATFTFTTQAIAMTETQQHSNIGRFIFNPKPYQHMGLNANKHGGHHNLSSSSLLSVSFSNGNLIFTRPSVHTPLYYTISSNSNNIQLTLNHTRSYECNLTSLSSTSWALTMTPQATCALSTQAMPTSPTSVINSTTFTLTSMPTRYGTVNGTITLYSQNASTSGALFAAGQTPSGNAVIADFAGKQWSQLSSNVITGDINSLTATSSGVYALGKTYGNMMLAQTADGNDWQKQGENIPYVPFLGGNNSQILSNDGHWYISGMALNAGPCQGVDCLAELSSNGSWDTSMNSGALTSGSSISTMALSSSGTIYAGGTLSSGSNTYLAAKLDSSDQVTQYYYGQGISGNVDTMLEKDGYLYIGGKFSSSAYHNFMVVYLPDNKEINWDDNFRTQAHDGNAQVHTMLFANGNLYVGGRFDEVHGQKSHNIAEINKIDSYYMGNGLPWPVYAIQNYNGNIYAAGYDKQTKIGGVEEWNGSSWQNIESLNGDYIDALTSTAGLGKLQVLDKAQININ